MRRVVCIALAAMTVFSVAVFAGGQQDGAAAAPGKVTLTIATVNNPDMVIMQEYSRVFTEKTGIELKFVVLPENELRQKVTEDVGLGAGKYDIVTIGTYDTPF